MNAPELWLNRLKDHTEKLSLRKRKAYGKLYSKQHTQTHGTIKIRSILGHHVCIYWAVSCDGDGDDSDGCCLNKYTALDRHRFVYKTGK